MFTGPMSMVNCTIPHLAIGPENGKPQILTFFFQKHPEVQDILHPGSESDLRPATGFAGEPYSGRNRPLIADMKLFRRWKEMCQKVHGAKCSQVFKGNGGVRPRVIDVNRRCLTFAEQGDEWVCLSYVWGNTTSLQLTVSNIEVFSVAGSLGTEVLPNVVEDALQVTLGLGERYLWVDCLCIVQDDEEDKATFISHMDSIYTLASIVIVAASCVDANSRLPGVQPGSRLREEQPFRIRDATLIRSLDPVVGVNIDMRTGRSARYLGDTVWDTRAWTLQERFLAARSLVFTSEQVFWECEEAFWCEDSFREIPRISPDPHRTSLCGGELNLSWNNDVVSFDHFYRVLLEEYSGRSLTFDRDGLNAFGGIIRALESSTGEKFFWGMPAAFLESALAWGHQNHALRRRHGIQLLHDSVFSGDKDEFPSWSWVGWTSDGEAKLANQNLTTEGLGLRFFCVAEDQTTMVEFEQATKWNREIDLLVQGSGLPSRGARMSEVLLEEISMNPRDTLSSALCFWTVCTHVTIKTLVSVSDSTSLSRDLLPWEVAFSQGSSSTIQVSWSHLPSWLKEGDSVEIAAIAQNRGDWDSGHIENGAIGVMLISREDGKVSVAREGFAWIAIRDWTALSRREWKLIVLK
ncbi:hypothetical protein FE257_003599 [Aspergillus nanangensis]|uniref:Heterokaryon incompatibility domain-containing protein n=1 Tax=Aspergillus nanangensis TaxID=2582783 RepID=A0AAD4CTN3_ASPNN|nr:hypothetical protein FE257_003599 [Aspergillus nanangensis]